MQVVKDEKILEEEVVGFRYDSHTGRISDMTGELRKRMEGFLVEKREIDREGLKGSASSNSSQAALVFDGQRETGWSSGIPYSIPQDFEVDLGRLRRIAEVEIDSYNDPNQTQVGYRVLVSLNRKDWREVFFAKRYTPDGGGLVRLYFEPEKIRFVKLEQVGFHEYASWVIAELKIYEAVEK